MPTKKTATGREYEVDGKRFRWFPLDDDDQPKAEPLVIPLRIKLGTLRGIGAGGGEVSPDVMFAMLEKLAPNQSTLMDDMDVNDFVACFNTWQTEYNALSGASLGESSASAG